MLHDGGSPLTSWLRRVQSASMGLVAEVVGCCLAVIFAVAGLVLGFKSKV